MRVARVRFALTQPQVPGFPCSASLRDRPSGLKGASRRRATALRTAPDPGASAGPRSRLAGRPVACPGAMRRKGNEDSMSLRNRFVHPRMQQKGR